MVGIIFWCFEVECGKGIYVCILVVDIGKKFGYFVYMFDFIWIVSAGMV